MNGSQLNEDKGINDDKDDDMDEHEDNRKNEDEDKNLMKTTIEIRMRTTI